MNKDQLSVGTKVYLKPVNNAARRGNREIIEAEIIKVGRKYFEVNRGLIRKYNIKNLSQVTEYAPDFELYFSYQEILDEYETNDLYSEIGSSFGTWSKKDLTLDQLRRIKAIINE
jgi:hypothetical protein